MATTLHQNETFKLGIHLGVFGLGVACALYNLGAFCSTGRCDNRNNALVYGVLIAYETRQVFHHARELTRE